jgi:hypothetical protein
VVKTKDMPDLVARDMTALVYVVELAWVGAVIETDQLIFTLIS